MIQTTSLLKRRITLNKTNYLRRFNQLYNEAEDNLRDLIIRFTLLRITTLTRILITNSLLTL
jgi:hypothetical protein